MTDQKGVRARDSLRVYIWLPVISVLRPLIYSLNPSRDIMAANYKCAYVRLQQVTAGYRTNYIARKSTAAKRLREYGAICMGRASDFV